MANNGEEEAPLSSWIRGKKKDLDEWAFASNPSFITHIVIHHSLTQDGNAVDWESIRKFHTSWRFGGEIITEQKAQELKSLGKRVEAPWRDIGYHFGVEKINDDFQVMLGRQLDIRGAHVGDGGFNQKSIGICFLGNFDKAVPPEKQWILGLILVKKLQEYYATKNMIIPAANVIGHREAQAIAGVPEENRKSCPGKLFDMEKFRAQIASTEGFINS